MKDLAEFANGNPQAWQEEDEAACKVAFAEVLEKTPPFVRLGVEMQEIIKVVFELGFTYGAVHQGERMHNVLKAINAGIDDAKKQS